MLTDTGELHPRKYLLVWPMPVLDQVRALYTMVFIDIFGLINYTCKVLTKTDTFHLIIPLNCLGQLLRDPVYKFPQVVHIDVICDCLDELRRIEPCFAFGFEKIHLCTIDDASKLGEKVVLDRNTRNAISSMIQTRISATQSDRSIHRSQIVRQFTTTTLHGFPVNNICDFASCHVCPSCKLVYGKACRLNCGHQHCGVCVNIQKNCATCSEEISRDKITVNENLHMEMQDLPTHCANCNWIQPLKDYEAHLQQNHGESITRFICEQETDENSVVISLGGACIWEIPDIEKLKNDAIIGERKSIYSPSFYLFPKGYKMRLRLFINGDRKARGTHMSLFFVIMRGEYDDKLQWPFKFKAIFSLIDQSIAGQRHISQPCSPIATVKCFEQPRGNMNDAFGIPLFIPLNLLQKNLNRYVRNGTIYFRIEIDLSTEKSSEFVMDDAGELVNDDEHIDTIDYNIYDMICFSGNSDDAPQS